MIREFSTQYRPLFAGGERANLSIKYPRRVRAEIGSGRNASRGDEPLGFRKLALSPPAKKGVIVTNGGGSFVPV